MRIAQLSSKNERTLERLFSTRIQIEKFTLSYLEVSLFSVKSERHYGMGFNIRNGEIRVCISWNHKSFFGRKACILCCLIWPQIFHMVISDWHNDAFRPFSVHFLVWNVGTIQAVKSENSASVDDWKFVFLDLIFIRQFYMW